MRTSAVLGLATLIAGGILLYDAACTGHSGCIALGSLMLMGTAGWKCLWDCEEADGQDQIKLLGGRIAGYAEDKASRLYRSLFPPKPVAQCVLPTPSALPEAEHGQRGVRPLETVVDEA